jgi:hypothetical protein
MRTEKLVQTKHPPEATRSESDSFAEPRAKRQKRSSPPYDGLSVAQTVEDDIKGSMQAVGQVCRAASIGVLLCGFGGLAALLGLLLL